MYGIIFFVQISSNLAIFVRQSQCNERHALCNALRRYIRHALAEVLVCLYSRKTVYPCISNYYYLSCCFYTPTPPSLSLFACLPVCLPACLSVCLSVCLCLSVSVSLCLSVCLSVFPSPLSLSLSGCRG